MANPGQTKSPRTEISFQTKGVEQASLTIEGADLSKAPDKIRQLMDVLELPKGTNATVTLIASDVIVR